MIMENYKKKATALISNLMFEYKADPAVVPHYPAKGETVKKDPHTPPFGAPEAHGISPSLLVEMLRALENDNEVSVHSVVVTKDGEMIAEASAPGYDSALPHLSHSMSKTVTGMLIHTLFDSGELAPESLAYEYFPEFTPRDERIKTLTVEHLLTMSSGVVFGEVGSVTEAEWCRAFFESDMAFTPGESFTYNSMNSYILMQIADRLARKNHGTDALTLLQERIFLPMGIKSYLWEKSPEGVPKGGWGLYLSARSWAMLGIMMLNKGTFNGRRILSENAVESATRVSVSVPREVSEYDYGRQIWVDGESGDFCFNGMLGQNVWVCPRESIVVSLTAGGCELMQSSPALKIIKEHLLHKKGEKVRKRGKNARELEAKCKDFFTSREWITLHAPLRGLPYLLGIRNSTPFDKSLLPLCGKYLFPENNLCILPSFVSAMQNNYSGGIKSLELSRSGSLLRMHALVGCGEIDIDLGAYGYAEGVLVQRGERFLVLGAVSAETDGEGWATYKIELIFPELPNTRRITLSPLGDGRLNLRFSEIPDERICPNLIHAASMTNPRLASLFAMLERTLGHDYLIGRMSELFTAEITAVSTSSPSLDTLLAEENERAETRITSSRLVRSIVARISREEASAEAERPDLRARLSDLLSRFGRK